MKYILYSFVYSTLKNKKKIKTLNNPYKINRVLKQVFHTTLSVAYFFNMMHNALQRSVVAYMPTH